MNKNILTAFAVMISLTVIIWSGCKKDNGPKIEEFIIQIDSMIHLDTINFGDTLSIKFYGVVGPNGCYAFDELVAEYFIEANELAVESWGMQTFLDVCTQGEIYMNGKELLVTEIPVGDLTIVAVQPDGPNISQNVYIKE
ncbi:MAG: hypothetical protein CL661_06350 [Bacteroidetes bacterium]|jgi:hypothetical protein|nr:hypothetical protein [Bacteroidota bacterium]|tara:strand:- start:278 stop:697 length:420 start_codon:yes stop_codon:yes gene_type:complete